MKKAASFFRRLRPIERAFTLSNEAAPLCVVCVLHLASPSLTPQNIQAALARLQQRHPLLRAGIVKRRGRFYFRQLAKVRPLAFAALTAQSPEAWRQTAEAALNATFPLEGPLLKCWYVSDAEWSRSQLILCFHHAIVDGTSARLILHEMLSLCGGVPLPGTLPEPTEARFPPAFRLPRSLGRWLSFGARQLAAERSYQQDGLTAPIPAHSANATINLRLSPAVSRALQVRAGRAGLSLNSVLLAALTRTVYRHRHPERAAGLARAISFVDLRDALQPPVPEQQLGCYISLLRLTIPLAREQSVWEVAAALRRAIFKASRAGEVYLMSLLSPWLIRMTFGLQTSRLGLSALSFIGKLDLAPHYGPIELRDVTAFITNNRFGPEFSAFGKILFGAIGLDLTYLTAECDRSQAEEMVEELKATLEDLAKSA